MVTVIYGLFNNQISTINAYTEDFMQEGGIAELFKTYFGAESVDFSMKFIVYDNNEYSVLMNKNANSFPSKTFSENSQYSYLFEQNENYVTSDTVQTQSTPNGVLNEFL